MKNLQKLTDLNEDFSYSRGRTIPPQQEYGSDFELTTSQTPDTLSADEILHYDSGIYENLPNNGGRPSSLPSPTTPSIDTYNPLDPHGDHFTGPLDSEQHSPNIYRSRASSAF